MKKEFFEYIGAPGSLKGYARSYKLVFFKCFFDLMKKDGSVNADDLVREFKKFYIERATSGKLVDANIDSRMENIEESTDKDIYELIVQNPYKHIREHGFMFKGKSANGDIVFRLSGVLRDELTKANIDNIIKIIDAKINLYYTSIDNGTRTNGTESKYQDADIKNDNNQPEDTMGNLYDEIQKYINKIENIVISAEKVSRKKNADALDIDDDELCQRMQAEAFREIKTLRNIKGFLTSISQEAAKLADLTVDAKFMEEDMVHTPIEKAEQINLIPDEYKQMDLEEGVADGNKDTTTDITDTEENNSQKSDIIFDNKSLEDRNLNKNEEINFELFGEKHVGVQVRWLLFEAMRIIMQKEPYAVSRLPFDEKYQSNGRKYFSYKLSELQENVKKLYNNMWVSEVDSVNEAISICNSFLKNLGYIERMVLCD